MSRSMPRSLQTGSDDNVAETAGFMPDVVTTTTLVHEADGVPKSYELRTQDAFGNDR